MAQQLTTALVRLSYVNAFTPKMNNQGVEKYSVTCLLPKSDKAGYEQIMRAINKEISEEADGKLKGVAQPKIPIHDGDGTSPTGLEYGAECKGHWVFTASANADRPPAIVDTRVQPIINQTELYSGCYGHVAISIYAYNNSTKGIGFGLNGIQKTKDGEALGSSFDAKSAFKVATEQETDPLLGDIPF